ncbi:MAG: PIN domain-containing protein [Actinomycetota bacterium]|nr:PIN domain-containing protein [Actinomycetota bacterium]
MGPGDTPNGGVALTRYLLDTTVLIGHLRGHEEITSFLAELLADGHSLAVCCVNVAEVEHGLRPRERKGAESLLDRLAYLETTKQAATRAGRYQADFRRRGRTLHTADALIAGTARAHGAILVTDNADDFPMRDVRVVRPPVR